MSILYVLIPLSLALMGGALWALFWAIDNGQFDELNEPSRSILEEDEAPRGTT
jgi:cbb3-type cytochrome oxidase maturation protein